MKKKYVRVGFTPAQKKELWERWRLGEQMKSIGREICKPFRVYSIISVLRAGLPLLMTARSSGTERHCRYVMLVKLSDPKTETVVNALIKHSRKLPEELYKSLTRDRGHELAEHKRFTMESNIKVYFCDPQSPWQRGTNENTNRLLRQVLPKTNRLVCP